MGVSKRLFAFASLCAALSSVEPPISWEIDGKRIRALGHRMDEVCCKQGKIHGYCAYLRDVNTGLFIVDAKNEICSSHVLDRRDAAPRASDHNERVQQS